MTLLFNDNPQASPVETGSTNKPKPVYENDTDVEVVAIITKVSTAFDKIGETSHFSSIFFSFIFSN